MRGIYLLILLLILSGYSEANSRPKLVLAGNISAPYIFKTGSEYTGADVELAKELANRMGLELVVRSCPLARCFKLLALGDIDLIAGLMFTNERSKFLSYLKPHYYTSQVPLVFYFHRDRPFTLDKYEDLLPLQIGVKRGVKYFERFDNDKTLKKVELSGHIQMVNMLLKKRIDTIIEREESIIPLVNQNVYRRDLVKANFRFNKDTNGYLALSKRSNYAKYIDRFSATLAQMKQQGVVQKIFKKYGLHHQ